MRKTRHLLPLIAVLFLACLSCQKSEIETIRMHGHVTNARTLDALGSVTLILQSAVLEGGVFHNNYTDVATAVSDASGSYSFETETKKAVKYRVIVSAPGYFGASSEFDPFEITDEESYAADFSIEPSSSLDLAIANVNPWDANDQITWSLSGLFMACAECCGSSIQKGEGPAFTLSDQCLVIGEQWLGISWTVTRNSNTKHYSDSVWMNSFDTIPYSIQY